MESESTVNCNNAMEEEVNEAISIEQPGLSESIGTEANTSKEPAVEKKRLLRFPLARIKQIMKTDLDCSIVSQDSVILVAKATELFLEYLGQESIKHTLNAKRKTLLKKDVDTAINVIPHLCFLDGILE